MNTKTLDNTANDPWADIATADLVNYVRNTGHFPPTDTRHQSPRPESTPGRRQVTGMGWRGPDGPCPPLTDPSQNVNTIIITIIAIFESIGARRMAGNITLDNLVSVSELSHGGVSKTLSRVGDNNPIVVMRNNKPAAIVISPDDYRRLTEAEEDFALYLEAEERMKKDDGTRLGMDDVFGKDYKPVDDGYVPEFE